MKKKHLPLLGVFTFFVVTAFTNYVTVLQEDEYETSDVSDLSFEERLNYHQDEVAALENYFVNVDKNPEVINNYNSLLENMTSLVTGNKTTNKSSYRTASKNEAVDSEDLQKTISIIDDTKELVSPQLEEYLSTLGEYLSLANQIEYPKREVFKDATGVYPDQLQYRNKGGKIQKGLKSKEALRKLKDLAKSLGVKSQVLKKGQLSVYPNPISEFSKISFINTVKGNVEFSIYDINGKKIISTSKELEQGNVTISSQYILNDKLATGLFILKIKNSEGKILTKKIMSK
jgi:hypothetical protein